MTVGSVARRSWRSFTGGTVAHRRPPTEFRAREGYTLRQRFWASFIGADLPPGRLGSESALLRHPVENHLGTGAGRDQSRTKPIAAGWFHLPQLPPGDGLTAAGSDSVLLEAWSPTGRVLFLVRGHGDPVTEYNLELIVRDIEGIAPLMTAVRYEDGDGLERVILVPVTRGRFGPAAAYVKLPGFAGKGWMAAVPIPVGPDSVWEVATVELSVRSSLNDATRHAWREVRALISDAVMRRIIDEELR